MDSPTMWTSSQVSAIKEEEEKDMLAIKEEEEKDMSAIKEEEEDKDMIMSLKRKDPSPEEEEEPKSDMKLSSNNNNKKQHLEDEDDHYDDYDEWNEEEEKTHYEDEKAHYYEYDEDEEHDGIWLPVPPFSSHLPEEKKKRLRRSLRDDARELINNPPVNHYDPFEYMEDTELMTVEEAKSYYKCAMDSLNGLTIDLDQVLVKEDGWGD